MGFESATPAVLGPLLLGGCVVLAFLKRMSPVNWLRAVSIALGLLALAGPSVTTDLRLPRVIFLLDESGSYRWASPLETLEEKTRGLPAGTPVMVAGFGAGVRLGPWTPADAFRAESVGAGASESGAASAGRPPARVWLRRSALAIICCRVRLASCWTSRNLRWASVVWACIDSMALRSA